MSFNEYSKFWNSGLERKKPQGSNFAEARRSGFFRGIRYLGCWSRDIALSTFADLLVLITAVGGVTHMWGMFRKHRLEKQNGEVSVWWSEALYWFCWLVLLIIAYLLFQWCSSKSELDLSLLKAYERNIINGHSSDDQQSQHNPLDCHTGGNFACACNPGPALVAYAKSPNDGRDGKQSKRHVIHLLIDDGKYDPALGLKRMAR